MNFSSKTLLQSNEFEYVPITLYIPLPEICASKTQYEITVFLISLH